MKRMMLLCGLAAGLALGSLARAQAPVAPPVAPAIPGLAAPAAPAAPSNMWSFLVPTKDQCANLKTCFCNSIVGQMVNGLAGPFSLMSGGLLQNRCLQNSILNNLKQPADTPAGAAARIAADEAAAKERRANIRALGLVDCNYWPEAIGVLATSLRGDRSECVRFEAALALRNGCCCNKKTVKALEMCVSGSNADGFPAERSDRVREVAAEALARCPIIETEPLDKGKEKLTKIQLGPDVNPAEYYKKVAEMPNEQVIASARATLASVQKAKAQAENTATATTVGAPAMASHPRSGSIAGIVSNAFGGNADPQTRTPFFTGLTRSLTGKQENTVQEYLAPAPVQTAQPPEIYTPKPREITMPQPLAETSNPRWAPKPRVAVEPAMPRFEKPAAAIEPVIEFKSTPRPIKPVAPREVQAPMPPITKAMPAASKPLNVTAASKPLDVKSSNAYVMPTASKPLNTPAASKPLDGKSDNGYIQLSPHVKQIQPAKKKSTPEELIPATPDLPAPKAAPAPIPAAAPVVVPTAPSLPASATIMPATYIQTAPTPPPAAANFTIVNIPPSTPSVPGARPAAPPEILQTTIVHPQAPRTVTIEINER